MSEEWMSKAIASSVSVLAWQGPYFLLDMVGVVLAIVFWARSPLASFLTLAAMVLMAMGGIVWVMQPAVSVYLSTKEVAIETVGWTLFAVGMFALVPTVIGFALLLSAVFVDRRPKVVSEAE